MILLTALNRRVMISTPDEPLVSEPTCNALVAIDLGSPPAKVHYKLTDEESEQFNELCYRIENRLAADIGDRFKPEKPARIVEPETAIGASS